MNVTQNPDKPVAPEVMAQSIVEIAEAFRRIDSTRLTRKALVVLIQEHSKVRRSDIELVLNNLADLERIWLKPAKK